MIHGSRENSGWSSHWYSVGCSSTCYMATDTIPTCKMTDRQQRHSLTGPEMMYISRPLKTRYFRGGNICL